MWVARRERATRCPRRSTLERHDWERRLGECDILIAMQHIANGKTDLLGCQFFRRHLVELRLEGVVVVLVD
jgi:hypothetical protein